MGNLLETVANSENRDAQFEEGRVDMGRTLLVNGVRTTGQDDTLRLPGQLGELLGAWEHLRVDIDLSQTAGNKVGAVCRVPLDLANCKTKNGMDDKG